MSTHHPDDLLLGSFATEEQKEKRLENITAWLAMFQEEYSRHLPERIKISHNAASRINSTYWETIESCVRPHMVPHMPDGSRIIDRHKIVSAMELVVCYVQPIEDDDAERRLSANAHLAYFIGLHIICSWPERPFKSLEISESFRREHLAWLREVSTLGDFPIFSNAATWYLIERIFLEREARESNLQTQKAPTIPS